MNKKKIIPRLIVSPFILCILIISYLIGCLKHWGLFLWYGGEWITYAKDDKETIHRLYKTMKKDDKE